MFKLTRTERQIIIVALVGIVTSAGMVIAFWYLFLAQNPCYPCISVGNEALNMDSYQFNSPTNLTMTIRNTGPHTVSLTAYLVPDSNANRYASFGWSGPTIPVNTSAVVIVIIDGRALIFQPRTSYTVAMLTAKNDEFVFTVTTN